MVKGGKSDESNERSQASNVEIHNAKLLSKDAFWNSENVTVYDSFISGEYLGWNAKKIDAD